MSFQYDQYLTQHRSNVKRGFDWIAENLPELLINGFGYGGQIEFAHDKSKDEPEGIADICLEDCPQRPGQWIGFNETDIKSIEVIE